MQERIRPKEAIGNEEKKRKEGIQEKKNVIVHQVRSVPSIIPYSHPFRSAKKGDSKKSQTKSKKMTSKKANDKREGETKRTFINVRKGKRYPYTGYRK